MDPKINAVDLQTPWPSTGPLTSWMEDLSPRRQSSLGSEAIRTRITWTEWISIMIWPISINHSGTKSTSQAQISNNQIHLRIFHRTGSSKPYSKFSNPHWGRIVLGDKVDARRTRGLPLNLTENWAIETRLSTVLSGPPLRTRGGITLIKMEAKTNPTQSHRMLAHSRPTTFSSLLLSRTNLVEMIGPTRLKKSCCRFWRPRRWPTKIKMEGIQEWIRKSSTRSNSWRR